MQPAAIFGLFSFGDKYKYEYKVNYEHKQQIQILICGILDSGDLVSDKMHIYFEYKSIEYKSKKKQQMNKNQQGSCFTRQGKDQTWAR